jgi:hypothetical protein
MLTTCCKILPTQYTYAVPMILKMNITSLYSINRLVALKKVRYCYL